MLRNKTVTKILSLLIAVALWGYVVWNTNPIIDTTIRDVPVQILNESTLEERGLTIISGPEGEYNVDIKVSGKKKDIGSLNTGDIFATADVGGYGAGETTVAVRVNTLDNISVVSINPGKLTFTIDTIASQEKEVRTNIGGELPDGMEVASLTPSLESVMVSGGQTLVDKVAYVRAELAAEDVSEGENKGTVQLVPVDAHGDPVEKVTLSEESTEVTAVLYYTKTVALSVRSVGEPAENVRTTHLSVPENITVRGSKAALADLSEIRGTVNINGISEDSTLRADLELPSGISLSRTQRTPEVTVTVETADDTGDQTE